jgi:hypothetical protein
MVSKSSGTSKRHPRGDSDDCPSTSTHHRGHDSVTVEKGPHHVHLHEAQSPCQLLFPGDCAVARRSLVIDERRYRPELLLLVRGG